MTEIEPLKRITRRQIAVGIAVAGLGLLVLFGYHNGKHGKPGDPGHRGPAGPVPSLTLAPPVVVVTFPPTGTMPRSNFTSLPSRTATPKATRKAEPTPQSKPTPSQSPPLACLPIVRCIPHSITHIPMERTVRYE